ncbi:2-hydroxyacid dehydrogenase [Deinococcus sp. UYEF24]
MRVLLAEPAHLAELEVLTRTLPEVEFLSPANTHPDSLAALLGEADVVISRRTTVSRDLIRRSPRLKLILLQSARHERVDVAAAREHGVQVVFSYQIGAVAVAELAVTLTLALSKKLLRAHRETVEGRYRESGGEPVETAERIIRFQWMELPGLFELSGKTLGLVGMGEIANELARLARAFRMRVLYFSRTRLPSEAEQADALEYRPLEEVLAESDIVSLHVPHTAQTEGMIDRAALHLMQPHAYLINTCRGGVVNEGDLVEALRAGVIAGAGLDVFRYEPIPFDHPLLELPNLLLTPHIGGGSGDTRAKQAQDLIGHLRSWLPTPPDREASSGATPSRS